MLDSRLFGSTCPPVPRSAHADRRSRLKHHLTSLERGQQSSFTAPFKVVLPGRHHVVQKYSFTICSDGGEESSGGRLRNIILTLGIRKIPIGFRNIAPPKKFRKLSPPPLSTRESCFGASRPSMRARRYACSPLMEPILLSPDGWSDSYRPDYPLQVCRRAHSEEPPVYQFPSSSLGFGAADAKLLFLAQFIENPAQHRQIVGTQHIKRRENHILCPSLTHLY